MDKVLELKNVSRVYEDGENTVEAINSINLTVNKGELVAIMGPSGSGKSTLLTISGGLEYPSSGQVIVDDQDIAKMKTKERASIRRKKIGYIFQDLNLLMPLTVIENVSLPLELDGMSTSKAKKIAELALNSVGIGDKAERYPDNLSGGERQRVAIARGVVGENRLLLADEPTGSLDSVNGEQIMKILRFFCDQGSACLMVTHDAQLAAWADRVVFIKDGHLSGETKPAISPETLLESTED